MRAPRIQMAELIPLAGREGTTPAAGGPFRVPFNPTTLKVSYTNALADGGNKAQQYAGKQSADLTVDLLFDTTDTGAPIEWGDATAQGQARPQGDIDVRIFTSRVVEMMRPREPVMVDGEKKFIPPRVRFHWGSFLFDGVLKSLSESLELFSAGGVPLRAVLSLTLTQDTLEFTTPTATGEASLFTPLSGASAAGAMASLGLDPLAGKLMAAVNGLDDLRRLQAGVALSIPGSSLSASAGASFSASAGASFSASAGASFSATPGGYGGGSGFNVTLGGGGNFGLDGGASLGVGVGVSGGFDLGIGIGGSLGFGAGAGIGASAGLSLAVSGGVSGGVAGAGQAAVALPGSGAVGGPRSGAPPGSQVVMAPGGRMALAPAAPAAPILPPSTSPAVRTDRTRTAPPPSQGAATADQRTLISGAVGVGSRVSPPNNGLPPPLPPSSTGAARGAFEGIHGVPLKRPRFSVGVPPLRPLAYRRLIDEEIGAGTTDPCGSGAAGQSVPSPRGCGCATCQGSRQQKGARCGCQHS